MAKSKEKLVHCRYPKCKNLHETTELNRDDAIQGGKSFYHPDCYHTMQTVNAIRDTFIKEINPLLTRQQVGMLVSTINNIIFSKKIDVDQLKFTVDYFIKNKPGALKYPAGLHYIIQDKDAIAAWKKEQERKTKNELVEHMQKAISQVNFDIELDFETDKNKCAYKQNNKSRFSSVLGG